MSLKEQIQRELDNALKQRQVVALSTLRGLLASLQNKEKEKRYKIFSLREIPRRGTKTDANLSEGDLVSKSQLTDEEIIDVIISEAKKRKEAIIEYEKGGRDDLVQKERAELEILQKYLPEQMGEEELKKIVKEAIAALKASLAPSEREKIEMKDMGKIMAEVMPKVKGKADGNMVSKIAKELL